MGVMQELSNSIDTVLQSLQYHSRIPLNSSVDMEVCKTISRHYKNATVNNEVVRNVITDIVFRYQLKHTEAPDFRLISFSGEVKNNVINEIVAELNSLPKKYEFIFNLPSSELAISLVSITNDIQILTLRDEAKAYNPPSLTQKTQGIALRDLLTGINSTTGTNKRGLALKSDDTILRIFMEGYLSNYGSMNISKTDDPLYIYKVILGYYINNSVLTDNGVFDIFNKRPLVYSVIDTNTHHIVRSFDGDTLDGGMINGKSFNKSMFEERILSSGKKELNITSMHRSLKRLFADIATDITPLETINQQRRLKNGLYWYYEAHKAPQTFLKITSTISAFDALASTDANAKKEYKADIISQLIANNVIEELEIKKNILELYKLRNSIVHGDTSVSSIDGYTRNGEHDRMIASNSLRYLSKFLRYRLHKFTIIPWA